MSKAVDRDPGGRGELGRGAGSQGRESSWQVGSSGLHVAMVGVGGQSVACLPTICAEPGLKTAPALLKGERPSRTASAVQIHGDMLVGSVVKVNQ